ncbi:unnamed protein product [Prunus armeniaca]
MQNGREIFKKLLRKPIPWTLPSDHSQIMEFSIYVLLSSLPKIMLQSFLNAFMIDRSVSLFYKKVLLN